MVLLLDTQVLVWLGTGDPRLSSKVSDAITDPDVASFVSAVTAWEYVDLHGRGRFPGGAPFDEILRQFALDVLEAPPELWTVCASLPDLHRDPVDRMLVAHAKLHELTIATADTMIRRYPVRTLW